MNEEINIISVIILSYNRCAEVLETISRLNDLSVQFNYPLEIIVVDNGSSDDTSQRIKSLHNDIILVRKDTNAGIAGWNDGFNVARGKYFLVLDDDSCVENGFIDAINYMENNSQVGILALNIVDKNLDGDPHLNEEEAWKDKENIVGFIGCGALIRRKLYEDIGGFATWIFVYSHEFEYSIRCLNAGYEIRFFEDCNVIHRASQVNRSFKRIRTYSVRNELAIVYKYFGHNKTKYLFRIFINNLKFMKREGLKAGYFILTGSMKFMLMRKILSLTPVSIQAQDFYAAHFWSTKPIFASSRKKHDNIMQQKVKKNIINA